MNRHLVLGVGSGVLAGALWGLVFLAPRLTPDFSPSQISVARYLAYGAIAAVLAAPRRHRLAAKLTRADWWALVWLGLAGNIVYYIFLAVAVQRAGAAPASLIVGLLPVVITIVGTQEEGAVPLRRLMPSLLLAVAGVALISFAALTRGAAEGPWQDRLLGLLCAAGALASWAVFAVGNARCIRRLAHVSAHDWSLLLGVVSGMEALVLVVPVFLWPGTVHPQMDWRRFLLTSCGIALSASVIGNGFWNYASRILPLTMTAQLVLFETLFALLYSFILAGRWPTTVESAAIAALIGGVWWCAASHKSPAVRHE
jgi:drug/metabolite transporter (DMT)-like permease